MKTPRTICFNADVYLWLGRDDTIRMGYSPPTESNVGRKLTPMEAYNILYRHLKNQK